MKMDQMAMNVQTTDFDAKRNEPDKEMISERDVVVNYQGCAQERCEG